MPEASVPKARSGTDPCRDLSPARLLQLDTRSSFFELRLDPLLWADIGERDVEQAVVHSHVSSPPRPSRTDVERIGLWQGRPYLIQAQGQGHSLTLRPRYQPVVDKLYGTARAARLSAAAIDALALVAYRQPATKQEIDSLRGAESGSLLRQLVRRGLSRMAGRTNTGTNEMLARSYPGQRE